MPNPLLIEQHYQALGQALKLIGSPRARLLRMADFIDQFRSPEVDPFFHAYAPELLPELLRTVCSTDFSGTPLPLLHRLETVLLWARGRTPEQPLADACTRALEHLRSEERRVRSWLLSRTEDPAPPDAADGASAGYQAFASVPMVEYDRMLSSSGTRFASVRMLKAEISLNMVERSSDAFHPRNVDMAREHGEQSLREALAAARHVLGEQGMRGLRRGLVVSCSFDHDGVTGRSFEAALALLLIIELLRLFRRRENYVIRAGTAITGRIRADGRLLPVDMDGLRAKIEACTYSPIRRLVVPREQAEECRAFAIALHRKAMAAVDTGDSPPSTAGSAPPAVSAPVEIIGVTRLSEVFSDRRITTASRTDPVTHAVRLLWSWRRPIAAMVILVLLGVVVWLLRMPFDRQPHAVVARGDLLEIRNVAGDVLDTITAGAVTTGDLASGRGLAQCADIDSNGVNEVIWAQQFPDARTGTSTIRCRTIRPRGTRWEFRVEKDLDYFHQPIRSRIFSVREILVADPLADGDRDVFAVAVHAYFPSLVFRIDGSTGVELGAYVHPGHLQDFALADLDGDGRDEILACGINNSFHQAAVLVLDPSNMGGAGPATEEYLPEGWTTGLERAYIRIPRTPVSLAVPEERYNRAVRIEVYPSSKTFRVTVADQSEVAAYAATVDLLFDFDLRVLSMSHAGDYDVAARRLHSEGKIPSIPDRTTFEELIRKVLYFDHGTWTHTPVPLTGR